MAKVERLKFNEVNKTERLYMKINGEIYKRLKLAKPVINNLGVKEMQYPLSRENIGGNVPDPVSENVSFDDLIEHVECAYLTKAQYDSGDLINDLNQYKVLKFVLELEIKNKNLSNDIDKINELKTINSIIYTLESLKEEAYLKTITKSFKDMINNIIDDQKLIK